jgi:hypothetical protein
MRRKPPATATPRNLWLPHQSSTLPVRAKNPIAGFPCQRRHIGKGAVRSLVIGAPGLKVGDQKVPGVRLLLSLAEGRLHRHRQPVSRPFLEDANRPVAVLGVVLEVEEAGDLVTVSDPQRRPYAKKKTILSENARIGGSAHPGSW